MDEREDVVLVILVLPVLCRCGKRLGVGVAENSELDSLVHEHPGCQDFVKRDPDDFLKWIRTGLSN